MCALLIHRYWPARVMCALLACAGVIMCALLACAGVIMCALLACAGVGFLHLSGYL